MQICITNIAVIRTLLIQDRIMKRHVDEAIKLVYSSEDGIKIYSSKELIGSYNLLSDRLEVLNDYINKNLEL